MADRDEKPKDAPPAVDPAEQKGATATKTKRSPKKSPTRKPPQPLPPWKVLVSCTLSVDTTADSTAPSPARRCGRGRGGDAMPGAGFEPAAPLRAADFKSADFASLSTRASAILAPARPAERDSAGRHPRCKGRRGPPERNLGVGTVSAGLESPD